MRKLLIVFGLLLLLGVAVDASAQEVLKGKVPIATGICSAGEDKATERPCVLFVDATTTDNTGWMLIFDKYGDAAIVVELTPPDGHRIVWRKGQVSL